MCKNIVTKKTAGTEVEKAKQIKNQLGLKFCAAPSKTHIVKLLQLTKKKKEKRKRRSKTKKKE